MMSLKKATTCAASVYDGYKSRNPLMMRKKMTLKDVVFRKDEPERELLHLEFSMDTELYVLLLFLVLALIFAAYKICRLFK